MSYWSLSNKQIKAILKNRTVDFTGCLEKADLIGRLETADRKFLGLVTPKGRWVTLTLTLTLTLGGWVGGVRACVRRCERARTQ